VAGEEVPSVGWGIAAIVLGDDRGESRVVLGDAEGPGEARIGVEVERQDAAPATS